MTTKEEDTHCEGSSKRQRILEALQLATTHPSLREMVHQLQQFPAHF